ncbi:MAG: holo-[acyl-carrier-protein] synthase [Candidatus Aminicenantes bacterium]|nr:holo-ACP synthase [Candidatus Aminicenantes bacterium]RLE03442.1 MAG: holo-[acyl-carrier-protein] synthase [Candidatus Aminicenantes bacterium]RLE04832.1 MAG: holo-[acyl-carrier-protein] synthase [Candidatus Aminicenantes bacterium]HHF42802.1 holo-[acyl-carrier-protein] synthase [Candidatus Aminicenantes bacterium]
MVVGLGFDLIEVERIKQVTEKYPKFLDRVFTPREKEYSLAQKNPYLHLAARFAAKEAFFKAIGRRIPWSKIGIYNLPSGQPELELFTSVSVEFDRMRVSLCHLNSVAGAVVILEKD